MGLIIDGFAHVMPKAFAETLMRVYPTDELRKLAKHAYFGDMQNRVRVMDKFGLDKGSHPRPAEYLHRHAIRCSSRNDANRERHGGCGCE